MPITIIKLGGSVLTSKRTRRAVLNAGRVRRLAHELADHRRRHPRQQIILLHGAGAFGHPLAYQYQLTNHRLTPKALFGYGLTVNAMHQLRTQIATIFQRTGLPILPLQTSALASINRGKLRVETELINTALRHRAIPLLGGDVGLRDGTKTTIISADDLAVYFAQQFKVKHLIFLTDVDGVLQSNRRPYATLNRRMLQQLVARGAERHRRHDVTGGMIGKLRRLLALHGCRVTICNGTKPNVLPPAFARQVGTAVQL